LRIATYNLLVGGERREREIHDVLRRINADVLALQEVTHPELARNIAHALRMELLLGAPSEPGSPHTAILSRRPVTAWENRKHPGRMLRSHLHATIATGGATLPELGVHCVHLAARFAERAKGEARRRREITAVLNDIATARQQPHVLLGDFNALSTSDEVAATAFFRRMNELRKAGLIGARPDGLVGALPHTDEPRPEMERAWRNAGVDPRLVPGIPVLPRVVGPLTVGLPVHAGLDRFLGRFIERWTVPLLEEQHYVDCFRRMHPRARGFTSATWCPAARVDYIFASAEVAPQLSACEVVGSRNWPEPEVALATDHHPVVAEFDV